MQDTEKEKAIIEWYNRKRKNISDFLTSFSLRQIEGVITITAQTYGDKVYNLSLDRKLFDHGINKIKNLTFKQAFAYKEEIDNILEKQKSNNEDVS